MLVSNGAGAQDKKVRMQVGGGSGLRRACLFDTTVFRRHGAQGLWRLHRCQVLQAGALVPSSQYFDAVANGSLDLAWTVSGFFTGKDIAFAMYAAVPFGPEQANTWAG